MLAQVVFALWVVLPAYLPNSSAALFGGGKPIDAGKTWKGRRVLGDGKTWRGIFAGVLSGSLLGLVMNYVNSVFGLGFPNFPVSVLVLLPLGAMLGDLMASFVKRRLGKERGGAFPLVDQLDFLIGALALVYIFNYSWSIQNIGLTLIAILFVLTPVVHLSVNAVGYCLGVKNEPW